MINDDMKLITDLAEQLKTMNNAKDANAQACIEQHIGNTPEAVYKLVQLVLIQHMAIEQLQSKLQSRASAPAPTSFLDGLKEKLFGSGASTSNTPNNLQTSPSMASPLRGQPTSNSAPGFLQQAMTVGAGVAGGMMLGHALSSLLNHNSVSNVGQPVEAIENNYYDDQNAASPTAYSNTNENFDDNTLTTNDATYNDIDNSFDDSSNDSF